MAQAADWQFDFTDRECLEYMKDFIPDRVFDAHTHPFRKEFLQHYISICESAFSQYLHEELGFAQIRDNQAAIYGSLKGYCILGLPMPDFPMNDRSNGIRNRYAEWMAAQADQYPSQMAGAVLVMPGDTEDDIDRLLALGKGLRALKCYQWFSPRLSQATMDEFLPESAWQVANRRGLPIVVHLARPKGIADPENLKQVLQKTRNYPNAKLVLAHCGSSFTGHLIGDVVCELRKRDNIWLDLAAICESSTVFEAIKGMGSSRILWGTDFPISMGKGRAISMGNGFLWLSQGNLRGNAEQSATGGVALYATEELMALYQACRMIDLPVGERENIFYHNARAVYF